MSDLLQFKPQRHTWSHFDVAQLVSEVCQSVEHELTERGIYPEVDVPANTILFGDRDVLRRALLQLVLNALEVMPRGGQLVVTSHQSGSGLELEIADSGPGVEKKLQPWIFQADFTTKDDHRGAGLSFVRHAADVHGGQIQVTNCPEGGAAFTFIIPRVSRRQAA